MHKSLVAQIAFSILLVIGGIGLIATYHSFLGNIGYILSTIGLIGIVLLPLIKHVQKKRNLKLLGFYLLVFSLANIGRHYIDFYIFYDFQDYWNDYWEFNKVGYLVVLGLWVIVTFIILKYSIGLFKTKDDFETVIRTKKTMIIMILVGIIILLEFPIFNWHGDFGGGIHGHSYWNRWHIH